MLQCPIDFPFADEFEKRAGSLLRPDDSADSGLSLCRLETISGSGHTGSQKARTKVLAVSIGSKYCATKRCAESVDRPMKSNDPTGGTHR